MARKEITVSEVHRYQVVTMLSAAGATIGYDPHGPDVVMAADFDRVTAERDALQALLTAADERADVLEGLLQTINAKASKSHISQSLWRLKTDMANIAQVTEAALKPAEGRNEPNCLRCLDKKTVPSNLAEGYVMDCPDCCSEEG
ncbi:hypothetical protein 7F11_22 [uncultured Caudovirales phage]|mgnify:CR=1 FL=1|uniref:Uncharacterized protein n=1 Tax=uncultured Caudovirales phage TaxID=2100421 RepID=A0A2H4J1S5_9CAUD|nr:hypothetical protein 10F10_34 [uncultured Caudovirales phage]ASN68918.1 hypothetical protein 7F11_22 [uncultured Caudovirales phage]ASN68992.1 hypothetical protein 8AX2_21 [uncultured Caudovirales phage]